MWRRRRCGRLRLSADEESVYRPAQVPSPNAERDARRPAGETDRVRARAPAAEPLADDRADDAAAVAHGAEVADAVDALVLVRRDLDDLQPGARRADVDQRLDLEPVDVGDDGRQAATPEGVVAVAEVGIASGEQQVDRRTQREVARLPDVGDVG